MNFWPVFFAEIHNTGRLMLMQANQLSVKGRHDNRRLGERLVDSGKLTQRDLDQALRAQSEMGDLIGRVLVKLGLVSEIEVAQALVEQLGYELVTAEHFPAIAPSIAGLKHDFLAAHCVYPLLIENEVLSVVMLRPQDTFVRKALHLATGLTIKPMLGLESEIEDALNRMRADFAPSDTVGADVDAVEGGSAFVEHLRDLASEAPVIRIVNAVVGKVIDLRASDIHFEPFEDGLHVRYRVDGVIQPAEVIPQGLAAAVVSRVKLLAHLNIAERRLPQDGRIKMRVKGHELDLRVSSVPTVHGESVVMRVLDRASVRFNLEDMGFSSENLKLFNELLDRPHGILLVTGPTGSGKTTTLYAALAKLDASALKIITVEDPVEYQLHGINQIHVHPQIGLTFASALRSILRQDPDIIMIGEMRDGETAQIAVQSALTGHLVLSTLHTNTAAGAVIRLLDMGVERYLITSSVNGVLAQRLVRRLCEHCKFAVDLPPEILVRQSALSYFSEPKMYVPKGCPQCRGAGYVGRTAIHEFLVLDEDMHTAIGRGADAVTLQEVARRNGMLTLFEDGLRKVASGETSFEEVLRVTQDQIDD